MTRINRRMRPDAAALQLAALNEMTAAGKILEALERELGNSKTDYAWMSEYTLKNSSKVKSFSY